MNQTVARCLWVSAKQIQMCDLLGNGLALAYRYQVAPMYRSFGVVVSAVLHSTKYLSFRNEGANSEDGVN
jgi:hypothetical protein